MDSRARTLIYFELAEGVYPAKHWIQSLQDGQARGLILRRLSRLEAGNLGDWDSVGEGVLELRIHFGPGYRVYLGQDGPVLVVILAGGDKHSQQVSVRKAQRFWKIYQERKEGKTDG